MVLGEEVGRNSSSKTLYLHTQEQGATHILSLGRKDAEVVVITGTLTI